jgi:MoaA/NifB/PqqE/SkfB family radical SAM enzyme
MEADSLSQARERIAVLFLQPQCNMTCLFCATEDGFQAMGLEQARILIQALHADGVTNVILGGGEPFAWKPGAMALAEYAKSLGLLVQIGTNGLALPEGYERSPWVDRYILPLESAEARLNDTLRIHRAGHHAVVLDRLRTLGRAGKSVTVSTVVTRLNLGGLDDMGRLLADYHREFGNLHAWHLYRLLLVGRGGTVHGPRLDVSAEDYRLACDRVRERETGIRILKRPDMLHSARVGFYWLQAGRYRCQSPFAAALPAPPAA